ncbi:hypothetical protein DR999_PMT13134 [Platysternon megacephalum]|uniref:Uncharacterized protein n=1 Tax=Platysternon megacephalum TaxID=55544 RepID=A0A4D9E2E7_9SAUR|nr:hypothetical protein DR999_PMT13134 [Platysternon megacephalum]
MRKMGSKKLGLAEGLQQQPKHDAVGCPTLSQETHSNDLPLPHLLFSSSGETRIRNTRRVGMGAEGKVGSQVSPLSQDAFNVGEGKKIANGPVQPLPSASSCPKCSGSGNEHRRLCWALLENTICYPWGSPLPPICDGG